MMHELKTLYAPDDWYKWRAREGGGQVRDLLPYEGGLRYVTDGKRLKLAEYINSGS